MVSRWLGVTDFEQSTAKKRSRRKNFLAKMEWMLPWRQPLGDVALGFCVAVASHSPATALKEDVEKPDRPTRP
jgi:hypothetical protein